MTESQHATLQETISASETILATLWGGRVRLEPAESEGLSNRSYLFRLSVSEGPASAPETVVAKRAPLRGDAVYDPNAPGGPAAQLFNDWAGLQFLTEVARERLHAPRFYGGNRKIGLIVMEDVGNERRLDHALLGNDPIRAADMLVALSQTVGRMHADTIGRSERYFELRRSLSTKAIGRPRRSFRRYAGRVRDGLEKLGVRPRRGFWKDLESVRHLNDPGPFYAYIHSDPCPDNCHQVGSELRLLDFEHGRFDHALLDGVYPRIHFPTCWCVNRIPKDVVKRAEDAYRAELTRGCPQAAEDTLFYRAVVEVCASWVFETFCSWFMPRVMESDSAWGISTIRQRVLTRLELLAEATEEFGHLAAVGATAQDMIARLMTLWPEVAPMPHYPAFRAKETE